MPIAAFAGEIAAAFDTLPGVCAGLCEGLRRGASDQAANTTVLIGEDAVDDASSAWRAIQQEGGAATAFQCLSVARATLRHHLARGEVPYVAMAQEDGRPVAILPVVLGHWAGMRTLRFLGDPLIQYGDALLAPAAEARHVEAAWNALKATAPASFAHFRKVRADAHIAALLQGAASVVASDEAPFVDVTREPTRPARHERELRRLRRRLAEMGEIRFAVASGADALPYLAEAINMKRQWLQARDLASQVIGNPGWESALSGLAGIASHGAALFAAHLTVNDRLAAIEIGLAHERHWYAFLGATRPEFTRAGPGHVLMADLISYCRLHGFSTYDLLAPSQLYKRAMASGAVAVRDYALALKPHGRLAVWAAHGLPAAKKAVAVLPPSARSWLLRGSLRPHA